MKKVLINYEDQDVFHRGYYIQLKKLKSLVKNLWPELVQEYSFAKRFNTKTGEIHANVAWDNVFNIVNKKSNKGNGLRKMLDIILAKEGIL